MVYTCRIQFYAKKSVLYTISIKSYARNITNFDIYKIYKLMY